MARDISVSIAVQGEKEFNQALKNAQSAVKVLASELKASEAAFDENADAQAYFANRNRIINAQIEQEREILRGLEQAVREAGEEFGEASAKTDKYRIEINRTQASIAKMEKALRESQREAEELGRDSTRVGRQIEDGLGDAAEDVSDKLEQMTQMLESDLGQIGGAVGFTALKDLGEMAIGALDGMASFVDETKDYRRSMSYLEINAKNAGLEFEYVKDLLMDVSSLTGDMDGAFEGISNLLATGFDAKEMEKAIELLSGAVIRFPETMKFESLAESLQETIATGSAAGAYAELLERLGVDLEEFNKAMNNATTAEERQQIALAYLNEHGLAETGESYKDANANLIELERSQLEYNDALAGLATALEPTAIAWTNFKTSFVTNATEMVTAINGWYTATKENLEAGQELIDATGLDDWNEKETERRDERDKQRAQAIAETPLGTALDWWGGLWDGKGNFWDDFFSGGKEAAAKEAGEAVDELTTGIEEAAKNEEENMKTIGGNFATQMSNGLVEGTQDAVSAAQAVWQAVNDELTREITIPAPKLQKGTYDGTSTLKGGGNGLDGSSHVELVVQIDKTTVARATSGEMNTLLGDSAERVERYG